MKDFEKEYLSKENLSQNTDPYLYLTPEVKEEMHELQTKSYSGLHLAHMFSLMVTAPLTVISASLQLSVKPHKKIYQEPQSKGTQLAKTNTALTLQEKRRMELMLRSGGDQKPYTAPVYEGYRGVLKSLMTQGWKSFFKGFGFRFFHQIGHYIAYYQIGLGQHNQTGLGEQIAIISQFLKIWVYQSAIDIMMNAFYLAENRYILQNQIQEFRVFRNGAQAVRKMLMTGEMFKGISYHVFFNAFETFCRVPICISLIQGINLNTLGILYLTQLLWYPVNTAFRRITCQNSKIPGMIPLRYGDLFHALRLIPSEEGLMGLYKGFALHHVTFGVRVFLISFLAPTLINIQQ